MTKAKVAKAHAARPRRNLGALVTWGGLAVVLALLGLATLSWTQQTADVRIDPAGAVAPDVAITTIDGERFALSAYRGRPVVLFYMASWCLPCLAEAQALARLQREYQDQGLVVLAVDVEVSDTPAELAAFRQRVPEATYAWAIDKPHTLVRAFNVRTLDTTIVLDRQGRVAYRDEVPTSYTVLKRVVEQVLQQ